MALSHVARLLSSLVVPVTTVSRETGAAGFKCSGEAGRTDKIYVTRRVTVTDELEQMEVCRFKKPLSCDRFMHGCRIVAEHYHAQVPSSA